MLRAGAGIPRLDFNHSGDLRIWPSGVADTVTVDVWVQDNGGVDTSEPRRFRIVIEKEANTKLDVQRTPEVGGSTAKAGDNVGFLTTRANQPESPRNRGIPKTRTGREGRFL